jgi:hypothetical protein
MWVKGTNGAIKKAILKPRYSLKKANRRRIAVFPFERWLKMAHI